MMVISTLVAIILRAHRFDFVKITRNDDENHQICDKQNKLLNEKTNKKAARIDIVDAKSIKALK